MNKCLVKYKIIIPIKTETIELKKELFGNKNKSKRCHIPLQKATTAKPISNEIHQQLIDILSEKGKVELKKKTDPRLLGGMIIRIGDMMIDNSIRRKLNILSDKLK